MKNKNRNIKIRVNVSNPTMMTIADLVPYPYNAKLREFTTDQEDHQYQNLKESIRSKGLNEPIHVWINKKGETQILSGHTRTRACTENGCIDIPVIMVDELEGKSADDPEVKNYWKITNLNVGITVISAFSSIEEIVLKSGAVDKDGKILNKQEVKEELKNTVCSWQMFNWINKLKYGYDLDGIRVEPMPHFIKDLEKGEKSTGVKRMTEIQLEEHQERHDPNAHGMPRDPEIEEMFMQLGTKWIKACKETLQKALDITHSRYKTTPLANADLQHISGTLHYIVSDFLKNEINNGNNKFNADAPNNSTPYDIYVYKNGHPVANIEVKTTKDTTFTSKKPKLGYNMLVSISKELNMWAAIVYLPRGSWNKVASKQSLVNLTMESIGKNKEWMYEYCGILDKNDDKWRMIKLDIDKNIQY